MKLFLFWYEIAQSCDVFKSPKRVKVIPKNIVCLSYHPVKCSSSPSNNIKLKHPYTIEYYKIKKKKKQYFDWSGSTRYSVDGQLFEGTFHSEKIIVCLRLAGASGLVGFDLFLLLEPIFVGHHFFVPLICTRKVVKIISLWVCRRGKQRSNTAIH